jgi:hypothetical protein
MNNSDYRKTKAWHEAVELAPHLVRLAEELPSGEEHGLSTQLRHLMVELPAAIASDLLEKDSFTRRPVALRLVAILDIIDKVYPALDTAAARTAIEVLIDRVTSDRFGEPMSGAKLGHLPGAMSGADATARLEAEKSAEPASASGTKDEASLTSVPVVAEPASAAPAQVAPTASPVTANEAPAAPATPAESVHPALKVAVTPEQEHHVQPNSVQ